MTKAIDEAKRIYHEHLEIAKNVITEYAELENRVRRAKENIINLEDEKIHLKDKRPSMLANNEDVSDLNKRLKEIDEEVELNQDTITGVKEKGLEIFPEVQFAQRKASIKHDEYLKQQLLELRNKSMKIAPKFAELLKDIITLESVIYGFGYSCSAVPRDSIRTIPNLNGDGVLFNNNSWYIYKNNKERVFKKYNLESFTLPEVNTAAFE